MKHSLNISSTAGFCFLLLFLGGCQRDVTEFGFDGSIAGTVKDPNGNPIAGDITSSGLVVNALGVGDGSRIEMRVAGDGSFRNTKLFPKAYKIWLSGPATLQEDTLRLDLGADRVVNRDLVAVPFLDLKKPVVVGTLTASTITVAYEIAGNQGKTPAIRELYVSTSPYATASTGSGPTFTTTKVTLPANKGEATVTGLKSKTQYYVRLGGQATGVKIYNYSSQITVTTL